MSYKYSVVRPKIINFIHTSLVLNFGVLFIQNQLGFFTVFFFSLSQIVQIHKISSALFKESVREEEKGELLLLFLNPYVKTLDLKILFVFMLVS